MESELTFDKYPFLKELGIEPINNGGYIGGKWFGGEEVLTTINPTTNEVNFFILLACC